MFPVSFGWPLEASLQESCCKTTRVRAFNRFDKFHEIGWTFGHNVLVVTVASTPLSPSQWVRADSEDVIPRSKAVLESRACVCMCVCVCVWGCAGTSLSDETHKRALLMPCAACIPNSVLDFLLDF